jgi:tRNA(fMet)-specific endonuclease VapC
MAYLLDTNVLSEVFKKNPNNGVIEWLSRTNEDEQFISVFTLAEIQKGISKLERSNRRNEMQLWFDQARTRYNSRILSFAPGTAEIWGRLVGEMERHGRILPLIDSFIAALAIEHSLTILTRNTGDFDSAKVTTLNVWE